MKTYDVDVTSKNTRPKNNTKPKKKSYISTILWVLILELFLSAASAPFIIFYGPFQNVKDTVVCSLFTTLTKKWVVQAFLSDSYIEETLTKHGYYKQLENTEDITSLNFKLTTSDKIDLVKIDGDNIMMKGYLLIIHDPRTIKVGYSQKLPIEGQTTSQIAKENGAIAAVNAGGFKYDSSVSVSTGGSVDGFILKGGTTVATSYKSDDEPSEAVGFNSNGQLIFGKYSANKLRKMGINEAVCFGGPKLIVNGKKIFNPGEDGGLGLNPRTAIGQKATGEVLLLVIDGRGSSGSVGAKMCDLQDILYDNGAVNAINLDGGSSTTMYYDGKVINNPSNALGERTITSAFVVIPRN